MGARSCLSLFVPHIDDNSGLRRHCEIFSTLPNELHELHELHKPQNLISEAREVREVREVDFP